MADSNAAATHVEPAQAKPVTKPRPGYAPRFNVVLLDDNDHTYEYVIEMLGKVFAYSEQKAFTMAEEVDSTGRVIVFTGMKEQAEFKQEQIHGYGADFRLERSQGAMTAILEPVE